VPRGSARARGKAAPIAVKPPSLQGGVFGAVSNSVALIAAIGAR